MDYQEQRKLIDAVLFDWPQAKRDNVFFLFKNRKVFARYVKSDDKWVQAVARCHPLDTYNCYSGMMIALSLLRVKCAYKESGLARKMKTWVPAVGQKYYVPGFSPNAPENQTAQALERTWSGDVRDALYLAQGYVFHLPSEARKTARRLLFEGRALVNFARKRDYLRECRSAVPSANREFPVSELSTEDIHVVSEHNAAEDLHPDLPEAKEEAEKAPVTLVDKETVEELTEAVNSSAEPFEEDEADNHIPDTRGEYSLDDFDLPYAAELSAIMLRRGGRYYMDPVTGEYCPVPEGES